MINLNDISQITEVKAGVIAAACLLLEDPLADREQVGKQLLKLFEKMNDLEQAFYVMSRKTAY